MGEPRAPVPPHQVKDQRIGADRDRDKRQGVWPEEARTGRQGIHDLEIGLWVERVAVPPQPVVIKR